MPLRSNRGGSKPDWQILQAVAERMGVPLNYASDAAILKEIRTLVPLYKDLPINGCWGQDRSPISGTTADLWFSSSLPGAHEHAGNDRPPLLLRHDDEPVRGIGADPARHDTCPIVQSDLFAKHQKAYRKFPDTLRVFAAFGEKHSISNANAFRLVAKWSS